MKSIFKKRERIFDKENNEAGEEIIFQEQLRELYNNPNSLCEIELVNNTKRLKFIWCEPSCLGIDLDENFDYKIVTHDKSFRIEFTDKDNITFWVNNSFGFKLYKREKGTTHWTIDIDIDMSSIN